MLAFLRLHPNTRDHLLLSSREKSIFFLLRVNSSVSFHRKSKTMLYKTITRKKNTKKFEINNSILHQASLLDLNLLEFTAGAPDPRWDSQFFGFGFFCLFVFPVLLKGHFVKVTLLILHLLGDGFCNRYFRKMFIYKNIPGIICLPSILEVKHTQHFLTIRFCNGVLAFITEFSLRFPS